MRNNNPLAKTAVPAEIASGNHAQNNSSSTMKRKEPPSDDAESPAKRHRNDSIVGQGVRLLDFEAWNSMRQINALHYLLQRSTNTSLQYVASLLMSSLKRDFISLLPKELTHSIFKHLDAITLSRLCMVSKQWRHIISSDAFIWKYMLKKEGWDDSTTESKLPCLRDYPQDFALPMANVYKLMYSNMHVLRNNWFRNRYHKITFTCTSCAESVVTDLRIMGDKIVVANDGKTVDMFDINTGKPYRTFDDHKSGVWCMEICGPAMNTLVTGSTDRTIKIWDIDQSQCIDTLTGHVATVRCLLVVPDPSDGRKSLLITGGRDSTVCLWKLKVADEPGCKSVVKENSSSLVCLLEGHTDSVRTLAAHDGILVSGSYDCSVKIWDIASQSCLRTLVGHEDKVYCVAYDWRNRQVVSGSMDTTIRVWSVDTGECLRILRGHTGLVGVLILNYCSFMPRRAIRKYELLEQDEEIKMSSNAILISAAVDSRVNVWVTSRRKALASYREHSSAATCIAVHNDMLVSGGEGEVKLYDLREGQFVRDLLTNVTGCWKVAMNERYLVCAVTRNRRNVFEVFDFAVPPM